MSDNILNELESRIGHHIYKIDANDPDQNHTVHSEKTNYLEQASVSAILVAMYEYVHRHTLPAEANQDTLNTLFHKHLDDVIAAISKYAKTEAANVKTYLLNTYATILSTVRTLGKNEDENIRKLFHSNKEEILSLLPSYLGIGKLLHQSDVEDTTHKMEGILSSFTKMLGHLFDPYDK